jgi:hypothetical protein
MEFRKLIDNVYQPRAIYDGVEMSVLNVPIPGGDAEPWELTIDLSAPEALEWRHYYTDRELNALKDELCFKLKFVLGREAAFSQTLDKPIDLQPVHEYGAEYTICFSYREESPGRYIFWLIAILRRGLERAEFDKRVADIKRYWLTPGS